jgi:hypothetical protein
MEKQEEEMPDETGENKNDSTVFPETDYGFPATCRQSVSTYQICPSTRG